MIFGAFASCGGLLMVLGYLIGVRKKLHLLAGCDPARVVDRERVARRAGMGMYVMGIGTFIVPAVLRLVSGVVFSIVTLAVYVTFILSVALWMAAGVQRYTR